jgi:hypothetical protein
MIVLKDVRFWIVLFFLIRLYGITNPPLELAHAWRQTDGLMIARNFFEKDPNIFYPRVDVAGEKSGIVGCEFPALNYSIYLISLLFKYDHWYGRLVVLLFTSLGTYYFYKSIRIYFSERIAFNAALLLLASFWFSYGRKNIPDAFAASLCLISLYCSIRYLNSGQIKHIITFFLLGSLGCLSKILGATILTVLALLLLNKEVPFFRKVVLSIAAAAILTLVMTWYFWWVPYLNRTYGSGDHFFMGFPYNYALADIGAHLIPVLNRIFITPLKNTGFVAFLIAIVLAIWKRHWVPLFTFLLPFLSYLILISKTGTFMIEDHYYILTMIPCFTFIIAYGIDLLNKNWIITLIIMTIVVEGIGDQYTDFRIKPRFYRLTDLERIMDGISSREDLIATNGDYDSPVTMYFAHRRGWALRNEQLADTVLLSDIKRKGCKYVIIAKELWGNLQLQYPIAYESEYFKIYRLREGAHQDLENSNRIR